MYSVSATKQEELFLWLCSVFILKAIQARAGRPGAASRGLSEKWIWSNRWGNVYWTERIALKLAAATLDGQMEILFVFFFSAAEDHSSLISLTGNNDALFQEPIVRMLCVSLWRRL